MTTPQGKIDEVRAEQRALDASLPSRVVIGMYSLSLTRMKARRHTGRRV